MKFNNKVPIYLQIMNKIKEQVINDIYKPGEKLPSVREMAMEMTVNPNTIQRVYQELDREGITHTKRGMGTYITEDVEKIHQIGKQLAENIFIKFIQEAKKMGYGDDEILEQVKQYLKEESLWKSF